MGPALLLLLISGPPFGFLPRDQWGDSLLYAPYHPAYAGGLGDVFGDKKDGSDEGASDEGTPDGSSTSDQGDKEDNDSGGLADVFGKKDKDGGSSGPYTTGPQKPPSHSTYPSYEDYPEAYPRPRPGTDSRPPSIHSDSLEAALEDIALSWLRSDVSYLERHLPTDGQVKVYRGTDLLETLSCREFLQATQEAFQGFKTVSFTFGQAAFRGQRRGLLPR